MEKLDSNSSSDFEEEKKTENNLKISDSNQNEINSNKAYYSIYGSGSVEGEEKEKETKNKNSIDKNKNEPKFSFKSRPSVIERGLIESIRKMENVTKENIDLAEKIKFKNSTDKIIETDEYGFFKQNTDLNNNNINNEEKKNSIKKKDSIKLTNEELLKINARTEKWMDMLKHYDKYQTTKKSKLKSRTRKGIPDSLRSQVWQMFAGIEKFYQKNLFENLDKEKLDREIELVIIKDLDRTFPSCQLFKEKYGMGQRKLFRVLANYSKFNKQLGYVQGMGYLVALFLLYMNEESSFYMLHSFVKNYGFEGLYSAGFPELKKKFYVLLNLEKKLIPRIYEILKRDDIYISIYASEWFLCLFAKDLKPNVLVRIFDIFLFEGYKVIYRLSLAFLKMKEKQFISNKKGIFYSMNTIKSLFDDIKVEELFQVAFDFSLSKSHIEKYEREYEENKNNPNNEFIKQL